MTQVPGRPAVKAGAAVAASARTSASGANQTLFVDAGSTALTFAQALRATPALRPLAVVTASYDVFVALADVAQVRLVLTGGRWDPATRAFAGPQGLAMVAGYRADLALLGACALHPRLGLTSTDAQDAAIKRATVDAAPAGLPAAVAVETV